MVLLGPSWSELATTRDRLNCAAKEEYLPPVKPGPHCFTIMGTLLTGEMLFLPCIQFFAGQVCSHSAFFVQIPVLGTASWTPRIVEMGGSPAVQKLELVSLGHPAAAHWVVHGATPASFVLQPTRVSGKASGMELGLG